MGWALSSHSIITSGQELPLAKIEFGLSLSDALEQGRLDDFAKLADERLRELGVVAPDRESVERGLAKAIRSPRSEDRTSHSSSDDGSTGT